jgi:hypothetical protein
MSWSNESENVLSKLVFKFGEEQQKDWKLIAEMFNAETGLNRTAK